MSIYLNADKNLQLNDREIEQLAEGPIKWAQNQAGMHRDIHQFTKDLEEQINRVGFTCEVKVMETEQAGLYAFEVELMGRTGLRVFDPDQMVHEVTTNYLGLKGEKEGFIKTREAAQRLLNRDVRNKGHKH